MKSGAKNGRRGAVWLEVLIALSVMSVITLTGMRAISGILEHLDRRTRADVEAYALTGLENRMQLAWRHRRAHRFLDADSWLRIQSQEEDGFAVLIELEIDCFTPRGEPCTWRLHRQEGAWIESMITGGGAEERILLYEGDILVFPGDGNWPPGAFPDMLQLRFPDASRIAQQHGFAMYRIW